MSKERYLRMRAQDRRDRNYERDSDHRRRYERDSRDYHMRDYNDRDYRDSERDRDYRRDYDREYDMRDYDRDYAIRGIGRPRNYDRRDYADDDVEKEYKEDLKEWTQKLKKFDRFGVPKETIINDAKQMGVSFDDYNEEEFYTVYLMHLSDYPTIANDHRVYLGMAKAWLEDKDIQIEPSEKLCKYMYEIVLSEE